MSVKFLHIQFMYFCCWLQCRSLRSIYADLLSRHDTAVRQAVLCGACKMLQGQDYGKCSCYNIQGIQESCSKIKALVHA